MIDSTNAPGPKDTGAAVALENVTRWYGDVVAVNDVSFEFQPGVTGLLGPNGAGKSTILHMLAGFLRPSSGRVQVLGRSAWGAPSLFRHIGLVPESESVYPFQGAYEFALDSARLHGLSDPEAAAARAISLVELEADQHRPMRDYSKGMRQRAKIAAGLVHDPEVLILDEPFNGTDPRVRLQLMELLRRMADEGRTVIFSSHILEEVERLADEVLVILSGRLAAAGDFREIRRLMTDRPHSFTVRTTDNRRLASLLIARDDVSVIAVDGDRLEVQSSDFAAFTAGIAGLLRESGATLLELQPSDESLESVFSYLVQQ